MKALETMLLILLMVAMMACQKQRQDNRPRMMLDSEASGENVRMVRPKEAVRPEESVADFKNLPNITQYDIEAQQRTPSKEIVYVKPGETVRPVEKKR